jgi:hypothetical protein
MFVWFRHHVLLARIIGLLHKVKVFQSKYSEEFVASTSYCALRNMSFYRKVNEILTKKLRGACGCNITLRFAQYESSP